METNVHMRLLSLLFVVSGLLLGCTNAATEAEPPESTPVRVAAAYEGPAAPTIRTNGLLVNKDEVRLAFKVGGIIKRITVQEGERVRRGQRLAELELTEVNAQVEQARQLAEKAQRDLERGERLYRDQVISQEQLDDLRTQAAVARAALQTAEFNSNYAAILAPADGTILRKLAEEREMVDAGTPVLVFGAGAGGFVVRASLADREIVQVMLGDPAELQLDAYPGVTLVGKVTERASAADSASGMFPIEVTLEPTALRLVSGLVAKVRLTPSTARSQKLTYVPIDAIVEGNGHRASVFVLEGEHARRRAVEVAFIDEAAVALRSGVQPGQQVITDGALYLEDGERVQLHGSDSTPRANGRG
jgi:RND family efflux transporter MFP subunit